MNQMKGIKLMATASVVLGSAFFVSCDDEDKKNISYGAEVTVGDGKAKGFIKLSDAGLPTEIGFTLSESALQHLSHEGTSHILPLPSEKALTPYDHISFDWAPHGHPPATIYDKPHFDIHFYFVTESDRNQIVPGAAMEIVPEEQFLPANYASTPGGVPQMGKHWTDVTAPELNGGAFTSAFVYGSYNGEVIFHEPMMTLDFFLSKPNTTMDIRQPAAFQKSSNYPTQYSLKFDEERKEYTFALLSFVSK
jgi:hypothetical protein